MSHLCPWSPRLLFQIQLCFSVFETFAFNVCVSDLTVPPRCSIWMTLAASLLWWAEEKVKSFPNSCGCQVARGWGGL